MPSKRAPSASSKPALHIRRRSFLKTSLLAGTALAMPGYSFAIGKARSKKPNVLFIPVDDLRPQLGCYGAKGIHTPNIDALAQAGSLFERAYCQQAVCSPSRTSLMTGLRPDNTGIYDLHTHFRDTIPDAVTLSQYFKQQGYFAKGIGKVFHSSLNDPDSWSVPWDRGGKRPAVVPPHESGYTTEGAMAIIRRRREEIKAGTRTPHPSNFVFGPAYEIQDINDDQHGDGRLAQAGLDALRERAAHPEQPFFLAVGFNKPHLPFIAPRKYWDMYPEDQIRLDENPFRPEGSPDIAFTNWGELRHYAGIPKDGPLSDEQARTLIRGYYACVSFVDAQIGLLLQALKDHGLWDNTLVALWGDHGFHLGDHGMWTKHTNFETAVHAPLIIRDPRCPGGQRSNGLCEFVDIYPTLADLAGLQLPTNLQGISLAGAVNQGGPVIKQAAFSQYPRHGNIMGYSMRTDRYRYTSWEKEGLGDVVGEELFDETKDAAEMRNIATSDTATAQRLRSLMNQMSPEVFCDRAIKAS